MSNAGRNVQMLRLVSVPGIGYQVSGIRNVEFVRLVFVSGIGYPSQHFHLNKSETEMMRSLVLKMMRAMSFISRQASILNFHVKSSALTTAAAAAEHLSGAKRTLLVFIEAHKCGPHFYCLEQNSRDARPTKLLHGSKRNAEQANA